MRPEHHIRFSPAISFIQMTCPFVYKRVRYSVRDIGPALWHISAVMKKTMLICTLGLAMGIAAALAADDTKKEEKKNVNTTEVAVIKTTEGDMILEFWPDVAPKTVENFKKLAKQGFYDGTCFHRVIKGFMIQGGDPNTKDPAQEPAWGTGGPGYQIKAEFNDRSHVRGVLSMARSSNPDSAGSQFFICHGTARFLDRQYTAFGKVIKGDDVLEKIANTPVTMHRGEQSKPSVRVNVESIKIVPADAVK
jgi:peptidyl-prolyl cis-trans isomerase B (cyclophilin B)